MVEGEKLATRLAHKLDGMFDELLKELAASGRYSDAGCIQTQAKSLSESLRIIDGYRPWESRSAAPTTGVLAERIRELQSGVPADQQEQTASSSH